MTACWEFCWQLICVPGRKPPPLILYEKKIEFSNVKARRLGLQDAEAATEILARSFSGTKER